MKISFIGDVHLGYKRKSFTSPIKGRYEEQIVRQSQAARSVPSDYKVQVGDVFDKFRGGDVVLSAGVHFCDGMDIVEVGNHDISNTLEDVSTMQLCSELCNISDRHAHTTFVFPEKDGGPTLHTFTIGSETLVATVPYCYTQKQFEASLQQAYEHAGQKNSGYKHRILVLHTNYNLGVEMTETTNNLTKEAAETLLEHFDYIVSGHEHNYSSHLKGRLIMTGSVMPVSTAELENKYVHVFDSTTGQFTRELIWDAKVQSVTYDVNGMPPELPEGTQFVSISGKTNSAGVVSIQKAVAGYWRECKSLLVCKPDYEVATQERKSVSSIKTDMVGHIRGLLKPPAKKLLDKMIKEINDEL